MSAPTSSTSSSISLKIQLILEEIISTIKALDILSKNEDRQILNRSLYRSMDSLVVLKCQLLQQQVYKLSNLTSSKPSPEFVDLTQTDLPISETTLSSTCIPGKTILNDKSKDVPIQEQSTSLLTDEEILVNPHSANICAGISKYLFLGGEKQVTCYIWCPNCLTEMPIFLTSPAQNLKTGRGMI